MPLIADDEENALPPLPIEVLLGAEQAPPLETEEGVEIVLEENGDVTVDLNPADSDVDLSTLPFDVNLAEHMSAAELDLICADLLRGIDADITSRTEWESMFAKGVELLGLKLEEASAAVSSGAVSQVNHPLLLDAVIRYQATAIGELLPAEGPVKVYDATVDGAFNRSERAEALEKDMNYYLTTVAKEYYPDFDRMMFLQGFSGCTFRKVYRCPVRRRPVSEYITGMDFIVNNNAVSLQDCERKTHRIKMRPSVVKRMQYLGHYRKVELVIPSENPTENEKRVKEIEGIDSTPSIQEDNRHTIYETYCELELDSVQEEGAPEGIPLPYRVTMDKDTQTILEIRRNWKEGDPDFIERVRFVKYGLIPGLGFYDYGFVHLLGNTTRALTAIERQLLDAGQFANFPGFLLSKMGGRQETTQIRVPPGGGMEIETAGRPISDVAMPLPYKEPSQVLANFAERMAADAKQLGMNAEIKVGDGNTGAQNMPVGTVLALLEQNTKVLSAVHKRNHVTQQQEFEIFKELFLEDPEALWKFTPNPKRRWDQIQEWSDLRLVPAADPNVPSHMHRIMRCSVIRQMADSKPGLYDERKTDAYVLKMLGVQNPEQDLFKPPAGPPDPRIAEAGMKFVAAETDKAVAQAKESMADAERALADAAYKRMEPALEQEKLRLKNREIDIKAFEAGAKVMEGGLSPQPAVPSLPPLPPRFTN